MRSPNSNLISLGFAKSLVVLGHQAQAVAISWFVYSLTKDPLQLGLVGLAEFLPAFITAFFSGAVIDRQDRKVIYRNALVLSSLVSVLLLTFVILFNSGAIAKVPMLISVYLCLGVGGVARAFMSPAGVALTGEIVARGNMTKANAWLTSGWQASVAVGPAIGGVIYSGWGPMAVFAFSLAMHILSLKYLLKIESTVAQREVKKSESYLDGIKLAWRFMRGEPRLFAAVLLDMLAVFFGGAVALLPIFAERLGTGPVGLGVLRAATAMGSLLLAAIIAKRPPARHTGRWLLVSVAGFGFCMIAFALSNSFIISFLALFMSGAFDAVSVIVRASLLQLLTPDDIKGRISALNSVFINSSNEFGAFESGVTARWMGPVAATIFGGIMTLVVVLVMAVKFPTLSKVSLKELEGSR